MTEAAARAIVARSFGKAQVSDIVSELSLSHLAQAMAPALQHHVSRRLTGHWSRGPGKD